MQQQQQAALQSVSHCAAVATTADVACLVSLGAEQQQVASKQSHPVQQQQQQLLLHVHWLCACCRAVLMLI
jgi:hypothetical protein